MALYDNKKKSIFRFPPFLTYIRYAHVFLLIVFYVEYRVLQSIYEGSWPWEFTTPAPTKWCEETVADDFARQPNNAFWSFSLCAAALFLSYAAAPHGRKEAAEYDHCLSHHFSLFRSAQYAWMNSSSLTLAAIFLFLMTLTSHACGCWGGEVWANAATDAVAAWPGFYIFWVYHNQGAATSGSRNRMLPRWSFMVFAALSVVSFWIYEYAFAWLGLGALYILPAASLSAYANWHWIQRTKEEHDNRVLRFAAIAFSIGYVCRLMDSWRLFCSPKSYFQFVSIWHMCFSVAITLQYLHLRAHHYRSVAASFRAPEGILGEVSSSAPRNKFT